MKTIWLVNPYGPIEGENWREYSFNQFGKYLSKKGYKVIWWTASFSHHFKNQRSKGWKDIIVNDNFIIRLVPTTSYKKNFGFGRMYKDYIFGKNACARFKNEKKPDLIIASENPLTMGKPSYYYSKKNNIPMIYDQMDIWPEFIIRSVREPIATILNVLFMPVYSKRKKIYDNLAGSIALGKNYLTFMHQISPSLKNKPSALIYNGINVDKFRNQLGLPIKNVKLAEMAEQKQNDDIWCVFAGTLGPSYDIKGIIECAKIIQKKGYHKFKFVIAGSGPFEEVVRETEKQVENFVYVGKLLPEELIPIYGKCDIGLATYSAGSNVDMCDKFYDYTAAGLAVINSLKGEIAEHIAEKDLGENYEANNVSSLMKAILALNDTQRLTVCKHNSWKAGNFFDENRQNEKLKHVIEQII